MKTYCQCYKDHHDGYFRVPYGGMADAWTVFDREPHGYFVCGICNEEIHSTTVAKIREYEDAEERNGPELGVIPGYNKVGERVTTLDRPTYKGKRLLWVGQGISFGKVF